MFLFLPCDLTHSLRYRCCSDESKKDMIAVAMLFRVILKLELAYFEIFLLRNFLIIIYTKLTGGEALPRLM